MRTWVLLADAVKVAVLAQERRHVAEDRKRAQVDRLGRLGVEQLVGVLLEPLCGGRPSAKLN